MTMHIDHLAVVAPTLDEGVTWVEGVLGVRAGPVGRHAQMGTWNRLISLGPHEYLEVIAIAPDAPPPGRARWFGLDGLAGGARLGNWVVASDDLSRDALPGAGEILTLERGAFRWRITVPADGRLPFDGLQPAQIEWLAGGHPAPQLPDQGCRLERLTLTHPEAGALEGCLAPVRDPRLVVERGTAPALAARIRTPHGMRVLGAA